MRSAGARPPSDGGYILVAVLGTMLVLASLMAASSIFVRSALRAAHVEDEEVATSGLLRAGLETAAYQLFSRNIPAAAISGRRIHFADAMLTPTVLDEAGKVDINGADSRLLRSLFTTVMAPEAADTLLARIVAIRGDDTSRGQPLAGGPASLGGGAFPTFGGGPPAAPPGGPAARHDRRSGFQSVEALRDFPEVTAAVFKQLAGEITVFNPDGKINILSADAAVLNALPGMTKPRMDEILSRRGSADKADGERLQAMLGESIGFTKIKPGPAFTVRVTVASRPDGPSRALEAVLAASNSPQYPFYVLDWRD
jgi:general secretion pathway protein K